MEELKPVAWMWEHFGTHVTTNKKNAADLEKFGVNLTPLYAIPDGCVAVPNGTVEKAFRDGFMHSGEGFNGELYCDGWTKVIDGFKKAAAEYKAMLSDATFPRGSVVDDNA